MTKQRNLDVQTPGAAPEPKDDEIIETGAGNAGGPTVEELQAQIASLQADNQRLTEENAKKAGVDAESIRKATVEADAEFETAGRSITRASRDKFLTMRADQVNPKDLVAAVLTKDGWVAPDQTGQKGKV